ncbi:MAG: peptidase M22 [Opitutaceae bacterium]
MSATFHEGCAAGPAVVVDWASSVFQVAVLDPTGAHRWARSETEAGLGLFACVEELALDPAAVNAWVLCTGPGSILGIRTAAMALRTWRMLRPAPFHAYFSLALVARAQPAPALPVIADARRETWHVFTQDRGLRRVPAAEVPGPCVTPHGFRHWSPLPAGTATTSYDLRELLPRVWNVPLLSPCPEPDAFLHEEPSYVTWTPQVHRAPS